MQLTGVQLTARQDQGVALQAHIGAATGDHQQLMLTDITLHTPDGATLITHEATWDAAQQLLRAPREVQVLRAGANLHAPSATFFAETGDLALDGPVRGQAAPNAAD